MAGPWEKYAQPEQAGPWAKYAQSEPAAPIEPEQSSDWKQTVRQGAGNLAAGLVRGAGSIGSTILLPADMINQKLRGDDFFSLKDNQKRRRQIDEGLGILGAETDSGMYATGKIAGEIAGTAGAPGALAKGASAIPALARFAPAIQSGGLSLGPAATGSRVANAAIRTGAGAMAGGAAAGLADPEQAGAGAVIGGALPTAVKAAGAAGKLIKGTGKQILGATTGTSAETVSAAFDAGRKGQTAFRDNMRGAASFDDVVDTAKQGLERMRQARGAEYRSGMVDIANDKSVLDFAPVDNALKSIQTMGSYKGVQTNKNASGVVDEIGQKIAEWKALDPAEYHTPEGFDALKRAIGDIRDTTQMGTSARRAADDVYNAVKGEISKQAPTYSKVMKGYAQASDELSQIEKTLSLGDKTSKDTAVRKLQSLMRNNAQSNYGNRLSLAEQLEQKGGVELTPAIAGQAMNTWMPRGLTGAIEKPAMIIGGAMNPQALAAAPLMSPRLVGEMLYATGSGARKAGQVANRYGSGLLSNGNQRQIAEGLLYGAPVISLAGQLNQR
jgi:hypothetical protein